MKRVCIHMFVTALHGANRSNRTTDSPFREEDEEKQQQQPPNKKSTANMILIRTVSN